MQLNGFNSTIRFSDEFYAAQKYFYQEAKLKFPKLVADKSYPEVPIKGTVTNEELKKIAALQDYFDARRIFLAEAAKYPEQIYPEVFSFLSNHPAVSVNAGNKAKFAALEKYFAPFFFLFSFDKHYNFNNEIKQNPCPLIFLYKDDKKNSLSFTLSNGSKKSFEFMMTESPSQSYISLASKKPIQIKAGANTIVKITIDLKKLKVDSLFKTFNLVFSDPTQPKVKLIVPIVLLPSKEFLSLPMHAYDLNFSYSTFFKHISLQKEKASWPEPCPNEDCSGKKAYSLKSNERLMSSYGFGDLCTIQYNLNTSSSPIYSTKQNSFKFTYTELGNLEGAERNCLDPKTGLEVYCAGDAPNNGKEIYGSRKIEYKLFVPSGKTTTLRINLKYTDLVNQPQVNSELSWLQDKVLVICVTDASNKQILKEFLPKNPFNFDLKNLASGTYVVEIFPMTEDGKLKPSFNIQHLNHGGKGRFDFSLSGTFTLISGSNPLK